MKCSVAALSQLSVPSIAHLQQNTVGVYAWKFIYQIFLYVFLVCWQFVLAMLGSQVSLFMVFVEGGRILLSHGGVLELSLVNVCVTAKLCDKISGLKICSLFNTPKIKYSRSQSDKWALSFHSICVWESCAVFQGDGRSPPSATRSARLVSTFYQSLSLLDILWAV